MHVWERGRIVKILITTLGNKKEQMYFLFKTEKKTKHKKSTAVAEKSLQKAAEKFCVKGWPNGLWYTSQKYMQRKNGTEG